MRERTMVNSKTKSRSETSVTVHYFYPVITAIHRVQRDTLAFFIIQHCL